MRQVGERLDAVAGPGAGAAMAVHAVFCQERLDVLGVGRRGGPGLRGPRPAPPPPAGRPGAGEAGRRPHPTPRPLRGGRAPGGGVPRRGVALAPPPAAAWTPARPFPRPRPPLPPRRRCARRWTTTRRPREIAGATVT